jgi:PhnB protein
MITINPYLNFSGNTEDAFNFYKSVFGGEFLALQRFSDTPHGDQLPEGDRNKLMHISLKVGETILMGTDALESQGHRLTPGNNFSLSLNPAQVEEGQKHFNALAAGGKITVPFEKAFWGAYFGMLTDKFGIQWMVNVELSDTK